MAASSGSVVDSSSPFRSVKEAIATYGHHLLPPRNTQTQKDNEDDDDDDDAGAYGHGGRDFNQFDIKLKKVEDELLETKFHLNLLNNKQSQTEVAIATLNAELHKSMSKIAKMEANEAANMNKHMSKAPILDKESGRESRLGEEWKDKDPSKIVEERPTLDQVLSFGVCEGYFAKVAKKKPIAPLITDIFIWNKSPTPKRKHKDDLAFLTPSFYSPSKYLT